MYQWNSFHPYTVYSVPLGNKSITPSFKNKQIPPNTDWFFQIPPCFWTGTGPFISKTHNSITDKLQKVKI